MPGRLQRASFMMPRRLVYYRRFGFLRSATFQRRFQKMPGGAVERTHEEMPLRHTILLADAPQEGAMSACHEVSRLRWHFHDMSPCRASITARWADCHFHRAERTYVFAHAPPRQIPAPGITRVCWPGQPAMMPRRHASFASMPAAGARNFRI